MLFRLEVRLTCVKLAVVHVVLRVFHVLCLWRRGGEEIQERLVHFQSASESNETG